MKITVYLFCLVFLLYSGVTNVFSAPQNLGDFTVVLGDNTHPHNFSAQSGSGIHATGSESRICVFCHTSHSASSKGPLWNRRDPIGPNGDGTFPLYGELSGRTGEIEIDTIPDAEYGTGEYPNGASRLCLSCHDGVTAIGEVINPGSGSSPLGGLGSILAENPASSAVIDLDTSHPISFKYNEAVRALIISQKAANSLPGIVDSDYTLPAAGILDNLERMQCTSCHDPHRDTNDGTYTLPMWKKYTGAENADYLGTCSECHAGGAASGGLNRHPGVGDNHPIP